MNLGFSIPIYNILISGTSFESPIPDRITQTIVHAELVTLSLDNYLTSPSNTPYESLQALEQKVISFQNTVTSLIESTNKLIEHIDERLKTLIDDLQIANAAVEINAYVASTEPNFGLVDDITGSLLNSSNALLDSVENTLNQLESHISNYEDHTIDKALFMYHLDTATTAISQASSNIITMIANEMALLNDTYKKAKTMSNTFAVESLINEPTSSTIIKKLANSGLSAVLN